MVDEVKIQQSNDDVSILSPIEDIINDARNGRMFILIDEEDRENEGDLVIPAQMATPDAVNFMATNGRGLICLALSRERINMLDIPLLPQSRRGGLETAFTVSIEARDGVTTGISAPDRARTISVAIDPHSRANDIVTPGHVFPLAARDGGVLVRAGHTEAGVDIARLAGLNPSSVICEIMNDDGTMARLPELIKFAQFHGIKIAAIADLIAYRRQNDRIVERLMDKEHVALVKGNVFPDVPTLVRMHSFSLGSDALGSVDARDSGVLQKSMEMINAEGSGIIVVIRDTSPTDESNRIKQLQSSPSSPVNELRDYGVGAQILTDLGVRDIILLSNSDRSIIGLEGFGLRVIETRSIGNKSQEKEVG